MAMNREQRRHLQRQGQMDDEGNPIATKRDQSAQKPLPAERTGIRQYFSEVQTEMKRVIWPTRNEVINYSIVVVITFVVITGLIALLDFAFAEGFLALLRAGTSGS